MRKTTSDLFVNYTNILKAKVDNLKATTITYSMTLATHDDDDPSVKKANALVQEIFNNIATIGDMSSELNGYVRRNTDFSKAPNYVCVDESNVTCNSNGKTAKIEAFGNLLGNKRCKMNKLIGDLRMNLRDTTMLSDPRYDTGELNGERTFDSPRLFSKFESNVNTNFAVKMENSASKTSKILESPALGIPHEPAPEVSQISGVEILPIEEECETFRNQIAKKSVIAKKMRIISLPRTKARLAQRINALMCAIDKGFNIAAKQYNLPVQTIKRWYNLMTKRNIDAKKNTKLEILVIRWIDKKVAKSSNTLTSNMIIRKARRLRTKGTNEEVDLKWYHELQAKHPWILDHLKPELIVKDE